MSYHRFAEMAIALHFGLTLALVEWWKIAGPIWREALCDHNQNQKNPRNKK